MDSRNPRRVKMFCKVFGVVFGFLIIQNAVNSQGIFKTVRNLFKGYPRAECRITWTLPTNCNTARQNIQNQMIDWAETEAKERACPGTSQSCPKLPCGQRCRYVFERVDQNGKLTGYHLTPAKSYRDNVSFEFSDNGSSCNVVGFSKSTVSYAVLDFGTNYCNLRNLIDGSGLSTGNGFQESTSTKLCTQYDQINCDRY